MTIKLIIEYDGTAYSGWQSQPNGNSIQQKIEYAIKKVTLEDIKISGSGRTDSGVHAKGQVASFRTEKDINPLNYVRALNSFLPSDIKIISSEKADDNFDARFSAKRKTYAYNLYIDSIERPLKDRYSVMVDNLDIEKMKEAAKLFVGAVDFKCFLAAKSSAKTTVRTVYALEIVKDGNDITVTVTANGFLYNMVRIMVGTLVAVGEGKIAVEKVKEILEGKDRSKAGKTMPARGLTLMEVMYE